jgi:anti-sigma factor RsiW
MTTDRPPEGTCAAGAPSPFPLERLSAFVDGDLPAAELQSVRQHLEDCAACADRAAELGALARAARALDAPEPPPTLWPAIEGALDRPLAGWLSWRPFGVGALAGAAVALVLVLTARPAARAVAVAPRALEAAQASPASRAAPVSNDPLIAEAEQEFARAAAVYERSIEKLRGLLVREEGHWSTDVRARYDERLARLDEAIVRSREVARRAPGDSEGNEQLFAAYQQKLAFLTETVHRSAGLRQGAP